MFKVVIGLTTLILFVQFNYCFATKYLQPADTSIKKLLYVLDGASNYMVPYIEQKLKNLRYADSDKKLFDSVANLNSLTQTTSIQSIIIKSLIENRLLPITNATGSPRVDSIQKYRDFLSRYNSVLVIKINTFSELIEFQFTLFSTTLNGDYLQYVTSMSTFIDPQKPHYQAEIIKALKQVFVKANKSPEFKITSDKLKIDGKYYMTIRDSIFLQPIIDDENPEEDRQYFWTQKINDSSQAPIDKSKKNQVLKGLKPGSYNLYFKIDDGVAISRIDTIMIEVLRVPNLFVEKEKQVIYNDNNIRVQNSLLRDKQIYGFPSFNIRLDTNEYLHPAPTVDVSLLDEKGQAILKKNIPYPIYGSLSVSYMTLLPEIRTLINGNKKLLNGNYDVVIQARAKKVNSDTVDSKVKFLNRSSFSINFGYLFFPLKYYNPLFSWFNIVTGINARITSNFFASVIGGSNLANGAFQKYFSEFSLGAQFPETPIEFQYSVLANFDKKALFNYSYGINLSFKALENNLSDLKFGLGYFTDFKHGSFYSIRYSGDFFFFAK
jgi:hypothetical protein